MSYPNENVSLEEASTSAPAYTLNAPDVEAKSEHTTGVEEATGIEATTGSASFRGENIGKASKD